MTNNINELVNLFLAKKYMLDMGAGKLSKRLKCQRGDVYEAKKIVRLKAKRANNKNAKILIFDIETAPSKSYIWSLWNKGINYQMLESDWFCLSWSAKWLFENEMYSMVLTGQEAKKEDDRRIIKGIWNFMDQADIVIAHNAKRFDVPRLNTRFLHYDLMPPSPYQIIDTLIAVKRKFSFTSNRLDYISNFLGFSGKQGNEDGFDMWKKSLDGDDVSLNKMEFYNRNDVKILEEVYLRIRPWIPNHPNIGLFIGDNVMHCPVCGSTNLTFGNSYYSTGVNLYDTFRCNDCGALGRSRISALTKEEKRSLLAPLAR